MNARLRSLFQTLTTTSYHGYAKPYLLPTYHTYFTTTWTDRTASLPSQFISGRLVSRFTKIVSYICGPGSSAHPVQACC